MSAGLLQVCVELGEKVWIWAQVKIIHNSSNSSQVRTLSLLVPKIHSKLSSRTHGVTVTGVGSLWRQSSGGCRFNPDYRRVTIQEYLTLVPGYGLRNQNRRTRGLNKGRSSKFNEGSRVRQTPEEDRRTYQPKRCGNINENNSPKTLNDKIY